MPGRLSVQPRPQDHARVPGLEAHEADAVPVTPGSSSAAMDTSDL